MKCYQLQFCITKKPRTKLPNSGRIVSQGRKALILHETLWKVHQSQILTGAQEFPSLWQEEMHFVYLMAVGSSRLQQLEKLWLSDSEGTGTIRAHPFWKGSQRVQPAVVELKINWKELTVAAVGMEVAFQRILEYAEFLLCKCFPMLIWLKWLHLLLPCKTRLSPVTLNFSEGSVRA